MTTSRARRLVVDVPVAVVVGWLLVVASQWSAWVARNPEVGRGRTRGGPPSWDWDAVGLVVAPLPFAVVMVVGLAVRRIWPRIAYLVVTLAGIGYVAAGGAFPAALLAVVLCVYVLAAVSPVRRWLPLTVLVLGLVVAAGWRNPYLGLLDLTTYINLVFAAALGTAAALLGIVRVGRRDAVRQRRADELERAASEERLRVAREVHDVVGHSLSVISMQAGVALHVLDRRPEQIRPALEAIRTTSSEAMAELRHALGVFRDSDGSPTAPAPTLDRLEPLVSALRSAGRDVNVDKDPAVDDLPTGIQQTGFRIVQESLTNVVRHAGDATADVRLWRSPAGLEIEVSDTGPLISAPLTEGNGLRGMRERVAATGGTLTVDPRPTGGLRVRAGLPVDPR